MVPRSTLISICSPLTSTRSRASMLSTTEPLSGTLSTLFHCYPFIWLSDSLRYRMLFRYLGCTEVASLSKEEQANHAFHLALAALLGDRIFNFGVWKYFPIEEAKKLRFPSRRAARSRSPPVSEGNWARLADWPPSCIQLVRIQMISNIHNKSLIHNLKKNRSWLFIVQYFFYVVAMLQSSELWSHSGRSRLILQGMNQFSSRR